MVPNYFGALTRRLGTIVGPSPDGLTVFAAVRASAEGKHFFGLAFPFRHDVGWLSARSGGASLWSDGQLLGRLLEPLEVTLERRSQVLEVRRPEPIEIGPPDPIVFALSERVARDAEVLILDIRPLRASDKGGLLNPRVHVLARFGPTGTRLKRLT